MRRSAWLTLVALVVTAGAGCILNPRPWEHPGTESGQEIVGADGAAMVWVPPGEFVRGMSDAEIAGGVKKLPEKRRWFFRSHGPQRKIFLDGCWIHKHEVTVAQYRKFCQATHRAMPQAAPTWGWQDNHPMVFVTWDDASAYAQWAGLSLPTEAQWEKAARGTDGRYYPWGNTFDASKCANSTGEKLTSTRPVGSYPAGASPYGCLDMAGNVWEYCADWYQPEYYKAAPSRNPPGPASGMGRVLRGGSFDYAGEFCFRCSHRNLQPARAPVSNHRGFRCASTPR